MKVIKTLENTSCSEIPIGSIFRICGVIDSYYNYILTEVYIVVKLRTLGTVVAIPLSGKEKNIIYNDKYKFDCEILREGYGK